MKKNIYFPFEIVFRDLPHSEAVELKIKHHLAKLARLYDHIIHCQIVIDARHRHQQGNIFHVSIILKVPEKHLVVNRDPALHQSHEDLYVCVRDVFHALQKQLKTYTDIQRKHIKKHGIGRLMSTFSEPIPVIARG